MVNTGWNKDKVLLLSPPGRASSKSKQRRDRSAPTHGNLLLWNRPCSFRLLDAPPTNPAQRAQLETLPLQSCSLPSLAHCLTSSNLPAFLRVLSQSISKKAPPEVREKALGPDVNVSGSVFVLSRDE